MLSAFQTKAPCGLCFVCSVCAKNLNCTEELASFFHFMLTMKVPFSAVLAMTFNWNESAEHAKGTEPPLTPSQTETLVNPQTSSGYFLLQDDVFLVDLCCCSDTGSDGSSAAQSFSQILHHISAE